MNYKSILLIIGFIGVGVAGWYFNQHDNYSSVVPDWERGDTGAAQSEENSQSDYNDPSDYSPPVTSIYKENYSNAEFGLQLMASQRYRSERSKRTIWYYHSYHPQLLSGR